MAYESPGLDDLAIAGPPMHSGGPHCATGSVLGWMDIVVGYRNHLDFGMSLSAPDRFIHRRFFAQRLQVANLIDPIRST